MNWNSTADSLAAPTHVADDGTRWAIVLEIAPGKEPVVVISGPSMPLRMDYRATTLMASALAGRGFVFGWGDNLFRFSPVAIAQIAREVIEATPGTQGAFVVTWCPNDPNFPF